MSLTLYTPKEVSSILKISYRATLNMIKTNQLKAVKVPGGYRVDQEDLKTYILNGRLWQDDNEVSNDN
tara:strand:+ start:471 stop:674 length:204 start_codon:yes stop_codon:yes gene_type:complete